MTTFVSPQNLGQFGQLIKGHVDERVDGIGTGVSGISTLAIDYDHQAGTFDPYARILDANGKPTGETIRLDHIAGTFGEDFTPKPTPWDELNALTHEESIALATVNRMLTFWEYRRLHPDGLSREEYGAARWYTFEYNGTAWNPTQDIDKAEEAEE